MFHALEQQSPSGQCPNKWAGGLMPTQQASEQHRSPAASNGTIPMTWKAGG